MTVSSSRRYIAYCTDRARVPSLLVATIGPCTVRQTSCDTENAAGPTGTPCCGLPVADHLGPAVGRLPGALVEVLEPAVGAPDRLDEAVDRLGVAGGQAPGDLAAVADRDRRQTRHRHAAGVVAAAVHLLLVERRREGVAQLRAVHEHRRVGRRPLPADREDVGAAVQVLRGRPAGCRSPPSSSPVRRKTPHPAKPPLPGEGRRWDRRLGHGGSAGARSAGQLAAGGARA